MNKLTLIIDTNIIFSALYKPNSKPGIIILLAIYDKIKLIAPISVRTELQDKLTKKLRFTHKEAENIISSLPIRWVEEEIYEDKIQEASKMLIDRSDAPLVALHLMSGCPIVTGDKELLSLRDIEALSPAQLIRMLIEGEVITKEELEYIMSDIE